MSLTQLSANNQSLNKNKNASASAARLFVAAAFLGASVSALAAKAPAARMKASVSNAGESRTHIQAGFTVPGVTSSLQFKVGRGKYPMYLGVDLDVLFIAAGGGVIAGFTPMGSMTMHIPTGGIATPTIGFAGGPIFLVGSLGEAMTFTAMVKPGVLIEVDKGMQAFAELRMGLAYGGFGFLPSVGMRFAI